MVKFYLKKIYNIFLLFNQTIISLLSVLIFSNFKSVLFFRKIKKAHIGGTCYIFGNGPSLKDFFKSESLQGKEIFVVNYFALSEEFIKVKPSNYIVLDNILVGNPSNYGSNVKKVELLYDTLSQVDWPLIFYYPNNGNNMIIEKLKQNQYITICIYNMVPISGFRNVTHWLFRNSLGMPWPQNISNAAIFCALNSGYKLIYLYGVEHSWLKNFDIDPKTHKLYLNDGHFYKEENIRWFRRGEYCIWVRDIYRALQSHYELREYADSVGAKIINKTPTSFIEAYEFEDYEL